MRHVVSLLAASGAFASSTCVAMRATEAGGPATRETVIAISTAHTALTLFAARDGRLYQLEYGATRANANAALPRRAPPREDELFPQFGNGFTNEPALQITH